MRNLLLTVGLILTGFGIINHAGADSRAEMDDKALSKGRQLYSNSTWSAWFDAALASQKAFHYISDTSMSELQSSAYSAELISIARDLYRKARSFGSAREYHVYAVEDQEGKFSCYGDAAYPRFELVGGLRIELDYREHLSDLTGDLLGCQWIFTTIYSSRNKAIVNPITGQMHGSFATISEGDRISIEDLILSIKR